MHSLKYGTSQTSALFFSRWCSLLENEGWASILSLILSRGFVEYSSELAALSLETCNFQMVEKFVIYTVSIDHMELKIVTLRLQ